ncbi:hypothetical protein GCM10009765_77700 [Fodinicola feengrottensis]|uniref:Uncharacterized protein n=1 Tax=Fodinicola feengrottensis TaxID=435914 RepID=A0ABN2J483_9ACTN
MLVTFTSDDESVVELGLNPYRLSYVLRMVTIVLTGMWLPIVLFVGARQGNPGVFQFQAGEIGLLVVAVGGIAMAVAGWFAHRAWATHRRDLLIEPDRLVFARRNGRVIAEALWSDVVATPRLKKRRSRYGPTTYALQFDLCLLPDRLLTVQCDESLAASWHQSRFYGAKRAFVSARFVAPPRLVDILRTHRCITRGD